MDVFTTDFFLVTQLLLAFCTLYAARFATRGRRGFSLIELITVIAIIAILMTFITAAGSGARKRARGKQAMAEVAAMETAVTAYRTDVGTFPRDGSGGSVNVDLVRQLSGLDAGGAKVATLSSDWNGPYMEFDRNRLDEGSGAFLDPWGHPYYVRGIGDDVGTTAANLHNKYTFDIWSAGPDGKDQGGAKESDDIGNF